MVLRETFSRIFQVFSWLLLGSFCLLTIVIGLGTYILVTTPWYDEDCVEFECRERYGVDPLNLPPVHTTAEPLPWTSAPEQILMHDVCE